MPLAPFLEIPVPRRKADGTLLIDPVTKKAVPERDKAGKIVYGLSINPMKQAVKGYWLVSDPVIVTLPAAAGAGLAGAPTQIEFLVDTQGHFDWAKIIGTSENDGEYTIEWFDVGANRGLENRPTHNENIVGSGTRPFLLPEPYFFNVGDSQRNLIATLRNLETAEIDVRLVLYGRRFYHKEAAPGVAVEMQEKFGGGWRTYDYFLNPTEMRLDGTIDPIPGGGETTFEFIADDTADTDLQKFMVKAQGAFEFFLRERDTNRTLMNDRVVNSSGWGTAEFPFYLADTHLLERRKALILEVRDLSGMDNRIFPTMAGRRLHYR